MKKKVIALAVGSAIAMGLAGCNNSSKDKITDNKLLPKESTISFNEVPAPVTEIEKRSILASTASVNTGSETLDLELGYKIFARSGDQFDNAVFGQLVDINGNPMYGDDGSAKISNSNEFTSLLPKGDRLFSVSQFESRPGAMFLLELKQDKENGKLSVMDAWQIDQSGVNGGWVHCAGSVTPWTTHLASEEYEPNARKLVTGADAAEDGYTAPFLDYFGGDQSKWNPYQLGWNIEVEVDAASAEAAPTAASTKHYAMGRLAFELSYVMPDQKTVYMTDDGTNVGLYMFVADKAGDLSAGNLYAMKWNQTSASGVGSADLEWISLGHANSAELKPYIEGDMQVKFADIFETADASEEGNCPEGFTSINAGGNGQECLQVKTGMEKVASRLETRRYAAVMGATTELRKEEGITFDPTRNKIYLAMSEVARGMESFKKNGSASSSYDAGGPDHIQLAGFNSCGAVYQLDTMADAAIGSSYVAKNISALVTGIPANDGYGDGTENPIVMNPADFDNSQNKCHIDGIANPDNVTYMSGWDKLIIGEDTGSGHQNDVIWAYDFKDQSLTRIQTTPYGSETTSPYWYPNINGWGYLTSVVQHPYGESDRDKDTGNGESRAYTGYIGPFPAKAE